MKTTALIIVLIIFSISVLFFSCPDPFSGRIPTPTPPPANPPKTISLVPFQGLETTGAYDWEYFTMEGEHYLAVASYYNGTNYSTTSKIYKWNGFTFTLYQQIATNGAHDWEYFSIEGTHYLAVANYYDGSHNANSAIYKWDPVTKFGNPQAILTYGAHDWEYFTIEDNHFLAVANYYTGSSYTTNSYIFKWNGVSFDTVVDAGKAQAVITNGATDWKHFVISGAHYLAVTNYYDGSYNNPSRIYKWNGSSFDTASPIEIITNGAYNWEPFTIGNDFYLAVANYYSGSYNITSRIYKWDTAQTKFNLFQSVPTNGANDWHFFTFNGEYYLAVANAYNDTSYKIDSQIYKWNGTEFDLDNPYLLATEGAVDCEFFSIGNKNFFIVANYKDDASHNILSYVYIVQ